MTAHDLCLRCPPRRRRGRGLGGSHTWRCVCVCVCEYCPVDTTRLRVNALRKSPASPTFVQLHVLACASCVDVVVSQVALKHARWSRRPLTNSPSATRSRTRTHASTNIQCVDTTAATRQCNTPYTHDSTRACAVLMCATRVLCVKCPRRFCTEEEFLARRNPTRRACVRACVQVCVRRSPRAAQSRMRGDACGRRGAADHCTRAMKLSRIAYARSRTHNVARNQPHQILNLRMHNSAKLHITLST